MLSNGNKNYCGFADEIVSYIYDEANATERGRFEKHLADCAACTDEFASVSAARYSIFEWRQEEFDHLVTPEIFIPSTSRAEAAERTPGLLAGLSGLFSGVRGPITAFATIAIILGMGFILMNYLDTGAEEIAANVTKPAIVVPESPAKPEPPTQAVVSPEPVNADKPSVKAVEDKPARQQKRVQPVRERVPQVAVRRETATPTTKAPVLTDFEESEDRSLRLSDLVGEGGVSH